MDQMDMLLHCRAMAAFCRQRTMFEGEDHAFWTAEAEEWDKLCSGYADLQPEQMAKPGAGSTWPAEIHDEHPDVDYPFRYRCPLPPAEQDRCRRPCELMLERQNSAASA